MERIYENDSRAAITKVPSQAGSDVFDEPEATLVHIIDLHLRLALSGLRS
jgi:hypothetical protein